MALVLEMECLQEQKCGSRNSSNPTYHFYQTSSIQLKRLADIVKNLDVGN